MLSSKYGLSPPYRLIKEQCWTVPTYSYLHGRPAFGTSCTDFLCIGCWHFDNGAISNIDVVLFEHGGLSHVLPHSCHISDSTN